MKHHACFEHFSFDGRFTITFKIQNLLKDFRSPDHHDE
jgi:hypothetical protein